MAVLVLNVLFESIFVNANGGNKVAPTPKCPPRELLSLFLNPRRGFTLENLRGIGDRVFGWNNKIQVDVFISHMPSQDTEAFPACNGLEDSFQFLFNVYICEYLPSILCCPYEVVLADIGTVIKLLESSIFGHTKITSFHSEVILLYTVSYASNAHAS